MWDFLLFALIGVHSRFNFLEPRMDANPRKWILEESPLRLVGSLIRVALASIRVKSSEQIVYSGKFAGGSAPPFFMNIVTQRRLDRANYAVTLELAAHGF